MMHLWLCITAILFVSASVVCAVLYSHIMRPYSAHLLHAHTILYYHPPRATIIGDTLSSSLSSLHPFLPPLSLTPPISILHSPLLSPFSPLILSPLSPHSLPLPFSSQSLAVEALQWNPKELDKRTYSSIAEVFQVSDTLHFIPSHMKITLI